MSIWLIVFVVLIALNVLFFWYYGWFTRIDVKSQSYRSLWLLYKSNQGRYSQVGPVMNALYADVIASSGLSPTLGFGLYYDNPKQVEADKCRAIVGCIINAEDIDKLGELRDKYGLVEMPQSEALAASFPYKGMISIFFGVMKVYKHLHQAINDKQIPQGPIMEVYDLPGGKIEYVRPYSIPNEQLEEWLTLSEE